jgi:predicted S18 family serine protease
MTVYSRVILVGCALLIGSCASKPSLPNQQLTAAQAAISDAERVDGGEYAPIELKQAQEKLNRAQAAVQKKDYVEAKRLAEQAEVDAKLAEAKAHSGKAQKSVAELNETVRELRMELLRQGRDR